VSLKDMLAQLRTSVELNLSRGRALLLGVRNGVCVLLSTASMIYALSKESEESPRLFIELHSSVPPATRRRHGGLLTGRPLFSSTA